MHNPHIDYGPRYLGTAVLSVTIVVLTVIGWQRSRRGGRKGVLIALCGYNALLMALFIIGLLFDDGFGWAFFPLLLCTAPWSLFIPQILLHWTAGNWLGFDLIGNFLLLVVVCGGINSGLLYLLIAKVFYSSQVKSHHLTS